MKADGSILIDTKIIDGGMEKGFELLKDEMSSVGLTAKKVGEEIELSFSKMELSKPLANAVTKVQKLEEQLSRVTSDYNLSVKENDDKSAERLAAKRVAVYERLEAARENLALEINRAVQKEAAAEEKATQQKIKSAEKEAKAKKRAQEKQFNDLARPARRFGSRLREIVSGALVFNLISAGLRSVTQYFGSALKSNNEFTASFAQLKGALLTAFQPIYEFVAPAIVYLIRLLTTAIQAIGRFAAAISGKSYGQMQKNAEALYDQANAINAVGGAAKEAAKQLAGFDEINRLDSTAQGGGGGGGATGSIAPAFSELEDSGLTNVLDDILRLVGAVGAALLTWKIASAFTDSLSKAAGLAMAVGGAFIYATSWADAFSNGIDWGNLSGMLLGMIALAGGLALAFGPVGAAIGLIITSVGLAVLALKEWIETGELSDEAAVALTIAIIGLGAALSLLTGSWIPLLIAGIGGAALMLWQFDDEIQEWAQSIDEKLTQVFINIFNWVTNVLTTAWENFKASFLENWNNFLSWLGGNGTGSTGRRTPDYAVNYAAAPALASYSATPEIPQLAKGAVIPPNKRFMAVLGDQTNGRNLEAPEDLIRQIVREESGSGDIQINFTGDLAQLARILYPEIHRQDRNTARARGW